MLALALAGKVELGARSSISEIKTAIAFKGPLKLNSRKLQIRGTSAVIAPSSSLNNVVLNQFGSMADTTVTLTPLCSRTCRILIAVCTTRHISSATHKASFAEYGLWKLQPIQPMNKER